MTDESKAPPSDASHFLNHREAYNQAGERLLMSLQDAFLQIKTKSKTQREAFEASMGLMAGLMDILYQSMGTFAAAQAQMESQSESPPAGEPRCVSTGN